MAPEIAIAGLADFLAAHQSLLAELYAQTQGQTPTPAASQPRRWHVSPEAFAATLYRSAAHRFGAASPPAPALETYLRGLHLDDLAMACALLQGSEAAWEDFLTTYRPTLYAAARAIVGAAGEAQARDLADSLYAELYGMGRGDAERNAADGGSPARDNPDRGSPDSAARNRKPLLQYFHGRSKLSTWLRAVLAQKFVDSLRATQRFQPLDEEREQDAHLRSSTIASSPTIWNVDATPAGDPDRERLMPHLREAFTESLAELAPTDRLLLSLYYVQELSLAQIARLRGVHEATISRQLDRLRRELRVSIERTLSAARPQESHRAGRAALSIAEIQLCFAYALEDWALDLGSHLLSNDAQTGSSGRDTGET